MSRPDKATLLLLLAIVVGGLLRGVAAFSRETITHDEAISYLSATGHQGEYERQVEGRDQAAGWLTAGELKRMVRIEKAFVLSQIGHDLAVHDFHPPLYFWMLHVWALLVGVHVWTGQLLNAVLAAVTTWLLFKFALELLGDRPSAAVVAATWGLSPAVLLSSVEARAYELFALCTVVMLGHVTRRADLAQPARKSTLIGLALTTTAGLLTHFHFAVIVGASVVWLTMRLVRRDRRRLDWSLAAIGLGCAGFLLAHPRFLWSFRRFGGGDPFAMAELKTRLNAVVATVTGFAVYGTVFKGVALAAIAAGLAWMILSWWRRRPNAPELDPAILPVGFFLLCSGGAIVALYLAFRSPAHAMGPKYLSPIWPLMAFVPVLAARHWGATSLRGPALVMVLVAGFGVASVLHWVQTEKAVPDPIPMLEQHPRIVVNNVQAAVLPRIIWHLPDDTLVFAAEAEDLLRDPGAWLDELAGGGLYVNVPDYLSTPEQRREVQRLLADSHEVKLVEGGVWGLGQVYSVRRATGAAAGSNESPR